MKKFISNKWFSRIVVILIIIVVGAAKLIYIIITDHETSSNVSLPEYSNLFTKEAQSKLQILATVKSNQREPESDYVYDKKYDLFVYRLILSENLSVKKLINIQNGTSSLSYDEVYSELPSYNFVMNKKSGSTPKVKTVNLTYTGNPYKIIAQTDSLASYYFEFNEFSIKYNEGPNDIVAKADKSNIPAAILFIKKGKFLYVILMTVNNSKANLSANQLYEMVNK